jgi:hypothetical protein
MQQINELINSNEKISSLELEEFSKSLKQTILNLRAAKEQLLQETALESRNASIRNR